MKIRAQSADSSAACSKPS